MYGLLQLVEHAEDYEIINRAPLEARRALREWYPSKQDKYEKARERARR